VELEANPDYFKGSPKIDKLYFKIVEPSALVAQLESGDIDMNHPDIGLIPYQDYERLEGLEHLKVTYGAPINYKFIGINTEKVQEKELRQAMIYGINRKLIVDNLLNGQGEVSNGPISPISPYYNQEVKDLYPYSPDKAKELLNQIGWDGSRAIELIVPTGQGVEDAANIIVENLRNVGININTKVVDMPTAIQAQISGNYDMALGNLAFQYDPDQSNFYKTGSSNNFPRYSNPRLDELFEKGIVETDPAERKKYYDEFQMIYMTDLPHIPLYYDYRMMAVSKRVTVGEPRDIGMLIDVHEWELQ
jgi:peptide/nickel transport system substrate-binding protein